MANDELKGKNAVVTGAARGIGKATAELLERLGATVFRMDLEPGQGIIPVDVADDKAVDAAFAKINRVDILVNNAGIAVRKSAFDISREEWEKEIVGPGLRWAVILTKFGASLCPVSAPVFTPLLPLPLPTLTLSSALCPLLSALQWLWFWD